ncbi:GNAT family N-acetyltransferase [Streptomyces sp. SYP-A7185]|uniref:GNAT family N-acetyltransferase n=1 Tax=Streptomyces sp. SYP-A7185 TaxID=3040076 RepID=UPI0038F5EC37
MTTEMRELCQADWDAYYGTLELAFGGVAEAAEEHELWNDLTEFDRFFGTWEGKTCVGTTGSFSFRLSVPGGSLVDAAGVTMVSVAATHRRQGILTSMMRRQLDDVRARGEAVAVLTASEPVIYGRFGYGTATFAAKAEIDTTRVSLSVPAGTDDVRLRYAKPADVHAACEALYARRVSERPGMLARQPGWERLGLLDPESERQGASPLQCVVAERAGELVGYARYQVKPDWDAAGPKGTVRLRDLEAEDPAATAALWRFLFGIDLTSAVEAHNRPTDDALFQLVSDVRRCRIQVRDSLHVRLVEVGAALEARAYRTPVNVVLDVEDAFCPWNEGRWRLKGDLKGAVCERTEDEADLALSVRDLGAAYLGGVSLTSLASAGRVRELRPGALAEATVAFGSDAAPWLPHGF